MRCVATCFWRTDDDCCGRLTNGKLLRISHEGTCLDYLNPEDQDMTWKRLLIDIEVDLPERFTKTEDTCGWQNCEEPAVVHCDNIKRSIKGGTVKCHTPICQGHANIHPDGHIWCVSCWVRSGPHVEKV